VSHINFLCSGFVTPTEFIRSLLKKCQHCHKRSCQVV
jgi:hypothetical protein